MDNSEREKYIREESEFKGMVLANLKYIQKEASDFKIALEKHLEEEMIELREFNERLLQIENWKIKVVALSSATGTVLGFLISLFAKKYL